jgi:hypothetical protein
MRLGDNPHFLFKRQAGAALVSAKKLSTLW